MSTDKGNTSEIVLSRLRQAVGALGLNKSQLADVVGYSKGQVGWILEGKTPASDKFLRIFCLKCNISEDWLKTGQGEMLKEGKGEGEGPYRHPDPTIQKIVELLEGMDDNTKEDVCLSVQKEKLLRDLLNEKLAKKAG